MTRSYPLDEPASATCVQLHGLAADNLLAFMALLGLLRTLDHQHPDWQARIRWTGRPWVPELLLAANISNGEIATAADEGISTIANSYRLGALEAEPNVARDVKFAGDEYRAIVLACRQDPITAALVSALSAEMPVRRDGTVVPAPLVLLHGQGHQHFLERLMTVPRLQAPPLSGRKRGVQARGSDKIAEALFAPWQRADETDGFRWDPADDQRYALRFGDPSKAGAAKTVHGANRLAAIGLLSFPCVVGGRGLVSAGSALVDGQRWYVWPIWTHPLTLAGIEDLLVLDLLTMDQPTRRFYGIMATVRALRVTNGKFANVTLGSAV